MCNALTATFSIADGTFEFETTDMVAWPPGDYVFKITGTLGDKSDDATFTLTLADPCNESLLSIVKPVSFVDSYYILGENSVKYLWGNSEGEIA